MSKIRPSAVTREPTQTSFASVMTQRLRRDLLAQPLTFLICRAALVALWTGFLAAGLAEPSVQAQDRGAVIGPATLPVSGINSGELLLGELNCTACHQAATQHGHESMPGESQRPLPGGLLHVEARLRLGKPRLGNGPGRIIVRSRRRARLGR